MADGLRVVTFNVIPPAYALVADWAARHRHRLVLVVTPPGRQGERYGEGHRELIAAVPGNQDILVTTRVRRTAAPTIAALAPDRLVSANFPHRIAPEVPAIPRFGAVNLHPAPLPQGRGPAPQRLIYDGGLTVAGTLHRIEPEFEAGAILGQQTQSLPAEVTPVAILAAWGKVLAAALKVGVPQAIAGDPSQSRTRRWPPTPPPSPTRSAG